MESNLKLPESASTKACPICAEQIMQDAKKCRFCGEIFDESLKMKAELHRIQLESNQAGPHPGLAALFSFFFPGAGQIYSGRVGTGVFWLFFVAFGYVCFIIPGIILHIICIFEARNVPTK